MQACYYGDIVDSASTRRRADGIDAKAWLHGTMHVCIMNGWCVHDDAVDM
jgi:hypothetical protein